MDMLLGILQGLGIFVVGPLLVGLMAAGLVTLWGRKASARRGIGQLACTVDADCPDGYVCRDGICVPATLQLAEQ